MFARIFTTAAAVLLCAYTGWAQNASPSPPAPASPHKSGADDESGPPSTVPPGDSLVGTWKAIPERLPLTGDFNEKVWGKDAVSVRDVSLTVKANGDATLSISRKVQDARGRVVPGSPSIEQADLTLGEAKPGLATRVDHDVRVVKAERRYPDNQGDRWPLQDLRVSVVSFSDGPGTLEVRFEPADGQGAFSELLKRQRPASTRR